MVDSKENYKFDLEVKGLRTNLIVLPSIFRCSISSYSWLMEHYLYKNVHYNKIVKISPFKL